MLDAAKLSLLPKRAVRVGPFDVSLKLHCSSLRQEANPATLNSRLEIVGTGQAVTRADGAPALAAYREMIVSEKLNDPASAVTMAANTALRFLDGELAALAKPAGGPPPIPKPTIFNRNNDATVDRPDLNLYARTKIGTRANHTVNEDSFGYFVVDKRTDPTTAIPKKRSVKGTVADGMGGHVNGAAASGIAVTESFEPQPLGRSVSIRYAHQKIVTSPENTQSQRSMGSTIVTFEWDPDRGTLDFSNIGDSPLYRVRANGGVQRLNRPEVVAWFSKEAVLKALKTKMIYTTLNDPERAAKKSALEALFDSQPPYNEAEILLIGEFLKRVVADNHNLAFQALKYALG
ncbi:MAG TPA: hypothetical protein VMT55_05240, partial [Candidatus Sulfotelmatobacter sp.]|nr:hypothetical protein [Candidatus Sulfotelmatobacter sp.]